MNCIKGFLGEKMFEATLNDITLLRDSIAVIAELIV